MVSGVGSSCLTLVRRRRTPFTFLGPVIRTKFLSITSTMTHLRPASLPLSLTQTRPTSIVGTVSLLGALSLADGIRHLRFRCNAYSGKRIQPCSGEKKVFSAVLLPKRWARPCYDFSCGFALAGLFFSFSL